MALPTRSVTAGPTARRYSPSAVWVGKATSNTRQSGTPGVAGTGVTVMSPVGIVPPPGRLSTMSAGVKLPSSIHSLKVRRTPVKSPCPGRDGSWPTMYGAAASAAMLKDAV
ncbi:MAG: hypothetical protein BWZ02_00878 [Lentisphaerae bacterium ADurb.BinA184]|nr:MAG: hypothetical protein BWZ02_00878 [Lentisphaerae bacterium ADurb.BinA184]